MVGRTTFRPASSPLGRVHGYAFAVGFCSLLAAPREAHAELPRYRVEYTVDRGLPCEPEKEFVAVLNGHLSKGRLAEPASRILKVHVGRTPNGDYSIDMSINELDGHVIEAMHNGFPSSPGCFKALYYATLLASVHIEHDEAAEPIPEPPPPPPPPCPRPPPPAAPPPPCPLPPRPPLSLAETARFDLSAAPILAIGMAPKIVPGLQAGGAFRLWGRNWIEIDVRWTPWAASRPLGPTVFEVLTASGVGGFCHRPGPFSFCGLLLGGATWSRVVDRAFPTIDAARYFGLGGRAGMQQHLAGPFSARADLDIALTIVGADVKAFYRPLAWSTSPITAVFGVRLVASFK